MSEYQHRYMEEFWFNVSFVVSSHAVSHAREDLCSESVEIYLAGDFNGWNVLQSYKMEPCPEGFSLTLPLSQGFYHYKFVIVAIPENKSEKEGSGDGQCCSSFSAKIKWLRDLNNPHVGGVHDNSIMFVHMDPNVYGIRPQQPPHREYRRPGFNGLEFHIRCPLLPSDIGSLGVLQRLIFVYLPPSYNSEEERRYPVVYANDGQSLFSTPAHLGGPCKGGYYLDQKLDEFWDQKLLPEFILIGVPNSDFVCIGNRNREYCTSHFHDTSQDPYKRYLVEVVKKEVDDHFRTISTAGSTVIMGSSMGGLCAFTLSLNHPDIFSSCVCISSSFWYADQDNCSAYDLVCSHAAKNVASSSCSSLLSTASLSPRIYIDSGDGWGDNFYETKEMREKLIECGWKEGEEFKYILDECADKSEDGVTHSESIWKERILPALQFALQ